MDGVLLCVKSSDTETVSAQIGPFLAPDCWIMSLQNGVDNASRASQVLGRAVIAAVVYVATAAPEPGLVQHFGRGDLIIGNPTAGLFAPLTDSALQDIADRFSDAGVPVKVSDAVTHALWSKLLVNCVFNALSALSQMDYGTLAAHPPTRQTMQAILDEVIKVASAAGTPLTPTEAAEATEKIIQGMPRQRSSTAQDLARRKLTEIDHLNGYIALEGLRLGVPTPVNSTVHGLVKLLESGF
jgi:2-dehydropantoate 2-reductase